MIIETRFYVFYDKNSNSLFNKISSMKWHLFQNREYSKGIYQQQTIHRHSRKK